LNNDERRALEKLVKAHGTAQVIAQRARIVLAASVGLNNAQIARKVHLSIDMVRQWRRRWLLLQPIALSELDVEDRLQDLPRSGTPARISADQVCQITALACEKPELSGRPITNWTAREVADEIIKRGIIDHISPRHAARLLKGGISSRT
jgi:putative transposase